MQTAFTDAPSALQSSPREGLLGNKSVATETAILGNLTRLGKKASVLTAWERGFLFDCVHLVESGEQLTKKQVAEIKSLVIKYL